MEIPRTPRKVQMSIRDCENLFQKTLHKLAVDFLCSEDSRILTVTGPTCSGKTTAAGQFAEIFGALGQKAVLFSLDDYFRDMPPKNHLNVPPPDYDSPDTLDLSCLRDTLESLKEDRAVRIPVYDFSKGRRTGYRTHVPVPGEIRIWEGIQTLYPAVQSLFGKGHGCLFLEPVPPENWICTGEQLRLFRRIIRDSRTRGADPAFTMHLWQTVRENERKNIYPYLHPDMIRINTWMPYEPLLLPRYLMPLLDKIPPSHAESIRAMLQALPQNAIEPAWIPECSLLKEFYD